MAKDTYTNKVQLYWCVKTKEEAVYVQELEKVAAENLNFTFTVWASDEMGYLTIEKLNLTNHKEKGYLICGPSPLKEALSKQLKGKGVSEGNIYDEEFAFR